MAITFGLVSAVAQGAGVTSITANLPTGFVPGDFLLLLVGCRTIGTTTITTPVNYGTVASTTSFALFGRFADGTETNPSITISGSDTVEAQMCWVRGAFGTSVNTVLDVAAVITNTGAPTAGTIPHGAITPVSSGDILIECVAQRATAWTQMQLLTGFSLIADDPDSGGTVMSMGWQYQIQDTPTTLAAGNVTVTGGSANASASILVAIKAAPTRSWLPAGVKHPGKGPGVGNSGGRFIGQPIPFPFTATSPDRTLALTGQAATFTPGALGVQFNLTLTGAAMTATPGLVTPNFGNPLTGGQITTATGTLLPGFSLPLAGSAINSAAGLLSPSTTLNLTGQSAAFTPGTIFAIASTQGLIPQPGNPALSSPRNPNQFLGIATGIAPPTVNLNLALTGQAATFTPGALGVQMAASLSGQAANFSAGNLSVNFGLGITGQSMTSTAGTLSLSFNNPLTGQGGTFGTGTLNPGFTIAVGGQSATFTPGTLSPGTSVALAGQGATFTPGSLTPALSVSLAGSAAAFAAGTLSPAFTIPLGGSRASFSTGTLTAQISFPPLNLGFLRSPGPGTGPLARLMLRAPPRGYTVVTVSSKRGKLYAELVSPQWRSLKEWADAFVFANAHLSLPQLRDETQFEHWASLIVEDPILSGLNLPRPSGDWESWVYQMMQVLTSVT